jgi:hypothetical protein
MEPDSREGLRRAATPEHQRVERTVEHHQHDERPGRDRRPPLHDRDRDGEGGERAQTVPPAQIQVARARAVLQEQVHPGDAPDREIGPDHAGQCPALQVLPPDLGVEDDLGAVAREPHSELDVLDRMIGEAAGSLEGAAADRAEPGPERHRGTRRGLVDVVVEQVPERGDGARRAGVVVIRAEERDQRRIVAEPRANLGEDVVVHLDVRVDEDQHVSLRLLRSEVARLRRRRPMRALDDDHLVGRLGGTVDRPEARVQGVRAVCRRHDDGEANHGLIVSHEGAIQGRDPPRRTARFDCSDGPGRFTLWSSCGSPKPWLA